MRERDMSRMPRAIGQISLVVIFLVFLGVGVLAFSPAYAGPETIGHSSGPLKAVTTPPPIAANAEEETLEEDTSQKNDADVPVMATKGPALPVARGEVNSALDQEAAPFRQKSGFDAFNAQYRNKWTAHFSRQTGLVAVLYGAQSRVYKNGPEAVARGFLRDTSSLFGLRPDLSDLATSRVDRTPQRDHVRLLQTYNGVPISGAVTLVHSNARGRVTMVQNGYRPGFKPANAQVIPQEAATATAQADLLADLGKDAILYDPEVNPLLAPHKVDYYYVWRVVISTHHPYGYWVYHIDAESGAILYKANEILSLRTGKARVYKSNKDWFHNIISIVTLPDMFSSKEANSQGLLFGPHAQAHNQAGGDPNQPDFVFYYDPSITAMKMLFDTTTAYYQLMTNWYWWKTNVMSKFYNKKHYPVPSPIPDNFTSYSLPAYVNEGMCNAFYDAKLTSDGTPGIAFGDEGGCLPDFYNEDFVIDSDVVRHEYTHAIMNWSGFDTDEAKTEGQFGGALNAYGRSMGEGNADFFAYLNDPTDPCMADVAFAALGCLRYLDNTRRYPWDVELADYPDIGYSLPEEHYTGEIWGGYLFDLYRVLQRSALPYVYQSYFYFTPIGGWRGVGLGGEDGKKALWLSDFFDGMVAQVTAELDLTGGQANTAKAWGSMASRGLNAILRNSYYSATFHRTYYHDTQYFNETDVDNNPVGGEDGNQVLFMRFPPFQTLKTKSNILVSGDEHEYPITVNVSLSARPRTLVVTATGAPIGGAQNLKLDLYLYDQLSGNHLLLATVGPSTPTAVLTFPGIHGGGLDYIIVVTGDNSIPYPPRGYYDLTISLK